MKRLFVSFLLFVTLGVIHPFEAYAQNFERAKYGSDFLSIGGGARALGMGGAHVGLVRDVTAGYWNPAGLVHLEDIEVAYMHSERFAGIVSYDYGAIALPIAGTESVVGVSFFRQGVDGIKNTLNAWDRDRNQPKANPAQYFTEFSAADLAFMVSYANRLSDQASWGTTAKVINSRLGPFAEAWGYSLDLGLQIQGDRYHFGINLMDITTMMKFWSVSAESLRPLLEEFQDEIPTGTNERVMPTVKTGFGRYFDFGRVRMTTALDFDLRFEGRKAYYVNMGNMSIEPHFGVEFGYNDVVFLRAGLTDLHTDPDGSYYISPTLGAGLQVGTIFLDYGFGSFSGMAADLGFTHRISLKIGIKQDIFGD